MSYTSKEHTRTLAFQLGQLVREVEVRVEEDHSMSREDIIEYFRVRIGDLISLNLPPYFSRLYERDQGDEDEWEPEEVRF